MKKFILFASTILLTATSAQASMSYECSRYVDGKPTGGHVKVSADSKSEAEIKAMKKYKDMGYKVDYVNCK